MPMPMPVVPECSAGAFSTQPVPTHAFSDIPEHLRERALFDPRAFDRRDRQHDELIPDEVSWRRVPRIVDNAGAVGETPVRFSRWRDVSDNGCEIHGMSDPSLYTVGIALQPTDVALYVDGRRINEAAMRVGSVLAGGPGQRWHAEFRSRSDFLHTHFTAECLTDCIERATGHRHDIHELFAYPVLLIDNVLLHLARALIATSESSPGFADVGASAMGLAMGSRVLELLHEGAQVSRALSQGARQNVGAATLAPWRMRKVLAFVDANLDQPLSLQAVADASGLSKMHFAALFRASTGLSPSEFVAQRRIERAQEVLLCTPSPVIEVALSLGFQTQAHFSTVFKRIIGETPTEWRRRHASADPVHES